MYTTLNQSANKEEKRNYKPSDIPNIYNNVSRTFFDFAYKKKVTEEYCRKWLALLGICTLFIGKGHFIEYKEKIDSLKVKINIRYDNLLDKRLGPIAGCTYEDIEEY